MDSKEFFIDIPNKFTAHKPMDPRDHSKLLVASASQPVNSVLHDKFYNLVNYLPENALLVRNITKVDASMYFLRKKTGGKVELLVLNQIGNRAEALIKGKNLKAGDLLFSDQTPVFKLLSDPLKGEVKLEMLSDTNLDPSKNIARVPLPPYIDREVMPESYHKERYQSVFAQKSGSVAAPTASLHFTEDVFHSLKRKNIEWVDIELQVGRATFSPIKTNSIEEHIMHSENFVIGSESVNSIKKALSNNRKIIPIGTTSMRVLEYWATEGFPESLSGDCDLFIYPGFEFKVASGIITNFHQGNSTLICLVAAFMGLAKIKEIYKLAMAENYRFFSYGDSCLFLK